jgi:hypothetical protein
MVNLFSTEPIGENFLSRSVQGWLELPATRGYVVNISPGLTVVQLGGGSLDSFKITKK